jgi:hypothetical protein
MSDTMVGGTSGGNYSWLCQVCGQTVFGGQAHICGVNPQWPIPGQWPQYQPTYVGQWIPFTLEDIRKVIREELDRREQTDRE